MSELPTVHIRWTTLKRGQVDTEALLSGFIWRPGNENMGKKVEMISAGVKYRNFTPISA
jgi:hypothetical protein